MKQPRKFKLIWLAPFLLPPAILLLTRGMFFLVGAEWVDQYMIASLVIVSVALGIFAGILIGVSELADQDRRQRTERRADRRALIVRTMMTARDLGLTYDDYADEIIRALDNMDDNT